MASANEQQAQARVETDLEMVKGHAQALQERQQREAPCRIVLDAAMISCDRVGQGNLDLQYLAKRCAKGQAAADNFSQSHNVYCLLNGSNLSDGPSQVMSWQRNHGRDGEGSLACESSRCLSLCYGWCVRA